MKFLVTSCVSSVQTGEQHDKENIKEMKGINFEHEADSLRNN